MRNHSHLHSNLQCTTRAVALPKKPLIILILAFLLGGFVNAKTFATVDGKDITDKDIAMILRAMPGANYDKLPPEIQQQVLNQAIEQRLLMNKAKKDGIQNSAEYKEALQDAQDELALGVWMKKQLDKITINDKEAREFYNQNPKIFAQPEQIKARHILVKDEKTAKDIIAQLNKAPKGKLLDEFKKLSAEKSIDEGIAQDGGELGWFTRDQMVPEFSDAAFKLAKGSFTKNPVKTNFGYHVILLEDKKASGTASYDTVKERVMQGLKMQKFKENLGQIAQELRKDAKVVVK